jgi:hypothetical protein
MIHLFSNHDKIVKHTGGELTAMEFDGLKVAYTLNKEAIVYGLDAAEYSTWIKEHFDMDVKVERTWSDIFVTILK